MTGASTAALSRGVGILVKVLWAVMAAVCILRLTDPTVFDAWPTARMTTLGLNIPLVVVLVFASVRLWASKQGRARVVEIVDQIGRLPIHLMLATGLLIVLVDVLKRQTG